MIVSIISNIDMDISFMRVYLGYAGVCVVSLALGSESVEPTAEVAALAADASRRLFRVTAANQREACVVRFESAPDDPVVLPAPAIRLLGMLLAELAKGNTVTLIPQHAELTTQEAADLLNVSRPYLVDLLESGRLPFHKVGSHRRVRFADLMTYKRQRDAESEEALIELARLSQELNL